MCDERAVRTAILERIRSEIRPRLDRQPHCDQGCEESRSRGWCEHKGYDCCGCSTYERIVEDIEAIVRGD